MVGALTREGSKIITFLVGRFVRLTCSGAALAGEVVLAGENMNGVGVGTETIKKRVYGGKCPGGEKSFRSVPKYVGPKTRFWTILVLQDSITA